MTSDLRVFPQKGLSYLGVRVLLVQIGFEKSLLDHQNAVKLSEKAA